MTLHPRRARRIRLAGLLVATGLLVEIVTLRWAHPTAFLVFACGAGTLLGLGVLLFLTTLFATGPSD